MKNACTLFIFFSLCLSVYGQDSLERVMGSLTPSPRLAIDSHHHIYNFGSVTTEQADELTLTSNAVQSEYAGGYTDGYIEKRDKEGELLWNTFIGGEDQDVVKRLAFYRDYIYVIGETTSTTGISTSDAFQEGFLARFDIKNLSVSSPQQKLFSLYPNPTDGPFTITTKTKEAMNMVIFDSCGRKVAQANSVMSNRIFDFSFKSGIYFVRLQTETAQQTLKLIVK